MSDIGFNVSPDTLYVISGTTFPGNADTYNKGTNSLTFTIMEQEVQPLQIKPDMEHRTHKK